MRIIAINRFYAPDHSASAQLLADLAEHLAAGGSDVVVVTGRQRYDDPTAKLPPHEVCRGVTVCRVWSSRFGRGRLLGRAVDYLSFDVSALFALLRLARSGDVILATTDPPLISVVAWIAAKLRGAKLINWCQDLYPEVAAALGLRWAGGLLGRTVRSLRNRSLMSADTNVVLCDRMAGHLRGEGVPRERIALIHNWADGELIRPRAHEHNPLRREWGLEGRRVIGYSGNLGRVHDLAAVRGFVATMARADPSLVFLFIGGGIGLAELAGWTRDGSLTNVVTRPYQSRERLAESLSVPDVHLVSLDPSCEGLVMPSKLYGALAAGRSVVVLGDPEGSSADIVRRAGVGLVWRPGRELEVLDLLERVRNPGFASRIRQTFEHRFDRPRALRQWASLLGVGAPATARGASRVSKGQAA